MSDGAAEKVEPIEEWPIDISDSNRRESVRCVTDSEEGDRILIEGLGMCWVEWSAYTYYGATVSITDDDGDNWLLYPPAPESRLLLADPNGEPVTQVTAQLTDQSSANSDQPF